LFSISTYSPPSRKELRAFGLILAAGFLLIAVMPVVFRHNGPRRPALWASILLTVLAILTPKALRRVYPVWMLLGKGLGWINSRVILSLLFFLVVTPIRLLMLVMGNDPMKRKFDGTAPTYRVLREARDASHMRHPF
jgi:hypothetical protein